MLSLIKVEENLASSTLYGEWHKINKFSNCLTLLLRSLYRHFKYKSESFESTRQAAFIEQLNYYLDILLAQDNSETMRDTFIKGILLHSLSQMEIVPLWSWQGKLVAGETVEI